MTRNILTVARLSARYAAFGEKFPVYKALSAIAFQLELLTRNGGKSRTAAALDGSLAMITDNAAGRRALRVMAVVMRVARPGAGDAKLDQMVKAANITGDFGGGFNSKRALDEFAKVAPTSFNMMRYIIALESGAKVSNGQPDISKEKSGDVWLKVKLPRSGVEFSVVGKDARSAYKLLGRVLRLRSDVERLDKGGLEFGLFHNMLAALIVPEVLTSRGIVYADPLGGSYFADLWAAYEEMGDENKPENRYTTGFDYEADGENDFE